MTGDLVVSDVVTTTGSRVDVIVRAGTVVDVVPAGTSVAQAGSTVLRGEGRLVHAPLVEPHAHLDKAYLAERVPNPGGDLLGAIRTMERARAGITRADTVARANRAVDALVARGVTHVRTHVDTTLAGGLDAVHALVEVREARKEDIAIQVAALLDWPLTGPGAADRHALARDAVAAGVDVVGGCPHLDEDPAGAVEWLVGFAVDNGLPLDLHADENLRPDSCDLETLADIVLATSLRHPLTASHCVSLSVLGVAEVKRVASKVAEAGIAVVTLPATNLYLQGRDDLVSGPRGIAPVHLLAAEGVIVAAGGDNLQDPFHPLGRADPYDTAGLLVLAARMSPADALDMVTRNALEAIGVPRSGPVTGLQADLVLVDSADPREAIAERPDDRLVVRSGVPRGR